MKTEPVPGIIVDLDPDTEDVTLQSAATEWETLADVYAQGELCPGCMFYETGTYNGLRWRECSCLLPAHCPGVNPRSIAAAMKRQAS